MPTYSYTDYRDNVLDSTAFAGVSSSINLRTTLNRAARLTVAETDMRSMKRQTPLAARLFDDIYDYALPADIHGTALIDLFPQTNRIPDSKIFLTSPDMFDRKKELYKNYATIADNDFRRRLRASMDVLDSSLVVATFDSLTADGGTWSTFSSGSTNLTQDTSNYIQGGGSLNWDISGTAAQTTAGVVNTGVTSFDITSFTATGSAFVWVYFTSATNVINFKLRLGSDSSNYYEMTATATNESTTFAGGWNLLRFDFSGKSTTGTPVQASCDYVALYMTKDAAKVSETDYRFDYLTLHTGEIYSILYYSKYPWQTSAGTYLENSTADTDKLNADTDEFDIFVAKGRYEVFKTLRDYEQMKLADQEYRELRLNYARKNPSQRITLSQRYY